VTLRVEQFGDVRRLRMSSVGARLVGLDVSAYVVRGAMIDTGFHRVYDELARAARELSVEGVVVTHWHEDHAGNVAALARRGLPIRLAPETESMLRTRPEIQLYRRAIWGHPPALESSIVPIEPRGLQPVHTPGHSEDHHVVWDAETGTLFSGDLWLAIRSRVLHSTEDPYMIVESLRRAAALGPVRMFDAHRGLVSNPVDALNAKADWLGEMMEAIAREISEGRSDREIVNRLLEGEYRSAYISGGDYSRRNLVKAVRRRVSG
jgi:glyoxylase-like metal-dependent hydrolase (beta-lactamase superfamily II)